MEIEEFLNADNILLSFAASSKKQLLEALSIHISKSVNIDHYEILAALHDRERLGSTGVGGGVAVPHARLSGLTSITGLYAHLQKPIPFESIDDKQVDLIFMLLMPEEAGAENLKALAKISRILRQETIRTKLRDTDNKQTVFKLFS